MLVSCDDHYMLVDGGDAAHSGLVGNYLRMKGVSHLDAMVSTHPHDDHLWGLSDALNVAEADTVYSPVAAYDSDAFRSFSDKVQKQGKALTVPKVNDTFKLGSASVRILGPRVITELSSLRRPDCSKRWLQSMRSYRAVQVISTGIRHRASCSDSLQRES